MTEILPVTGTDVPRSMLTVDDRGIPFAVYDVEVINSHSIQVAEIFIQTEKIVADAIAGGPTNRDQ